MGIYIFNRKVLEKYLIEDENTLGSNNDFGKNIIPQMLNDGKGLYAYPFDGYWRDIGTIDSIWEEPITFKVRVIRGLTLSAREIVIHVER